MIVDKMDYIFAIAKEQNLTRAAKSLFVSQSTLTMYLNRVEGELGIKLFDRSKTPILPTPAGELCIEELKKIRQIETRLSGRLQQLAHPEEILNVGIGLMHSVAWMPRLLPLFHEHYPDVSVRLIEQGDELLLKALQSNDADIIIGGMPVSTQDVTVTLALEQLLLIVPRAFNIIPSWATQEIPMRILTKSIPSSYRVCRSFCRPQLMTSVALRIRFWSILISDPNS